MTPRAGDQSGFTLIELLVATMIGTVVLLAAFSLLDMAFRGQATTENRLDATASGRDVMERLTRQIRAQVCLGKGLPPAIEATDTRFSFYASVAPAPASSAATMPVQRRTLEFVPAAGSTRGSFVETVVDGTDTIPPAFTAAPRTAQIGAQLAPAGGVPIFRYFRYDATSPTGLTKLTTPVVDPAALASIVQVETAYDAWPVGARDAATVKAPFDSRITTRTGDPSDPGPRCL